VSVLAITGGTGFVGGHLIAQALAAGHAIRALARRAQPPRPGVTWIEGSLAAPDALARLMEGADAVVHVAGVVNAPDRAGFAAGHIAGTRAVVAAASAARVTRFVHVSSLAAREPGLSNYGWSKREAEGVVEASDLDWTIVRPTGVYGPGDTDMLDMFRMARWGLALLPPPGRVSLVAAEDLARLLLALAEKGGPRAVMDADDGSAGYSHAALARMIGEAVGRRRMLTLALPRPVLVAGAWADRLLRGSGAKLTPDRAGYLSHPDWTADPARRPPPALWTPAIPTPEGLAATARWYRAHGLL
jgi:nucleoside-diphosphate-sugar epimerase